MVVYTMGLFGRRKSKNWDYLRNKGYDEDARNRDVHGAQNMERGDITKATKPTKYRVFGIIIALIFAGISFGVLHLLLMLYGFFQHVSNNPAQSFTEYGIGDVVVTHGLLSYAVPFFVFLIAWGIANERMMAHWRSENSMSDTTDINSHENDQHIMLSQEAQRKFSWFPNTGAHSSVSVSSMLSHVMISRKGLKQVDVTKRYKKDKTVDGVVHHKGEIMYDDDGNVLTDRMPLIDEEFGQDLFTSSGIPVDQKSIRTPVDVRKIEYNPKDSTGDREDRDKLPYDKVVDLINNDWEFPEYEVQRPSGAYLVDTAPVNTMVLAITRAGKGRQARFV